MTISVYQKGDLARITGNFKNAAGADADPTTVTFKYTNPAGTITTLIYLTDAALVKDSTGNYHVDVSINAAGMWYYRWQGTGAVETAQEGEFCVEPSGM